MEEKKGWYNERVGLLLTIVGFAIFVVAWLVMDPLGTGLGPSESPGRVLLLNITAFVFCLPFAAYWMYKFAKRPDWLAMPGRYIKGMTVKAFSPYALVGMGIIGALFAAAGFGDLGGLDVQAMVISASAALFGSIVSFFGLFVGQIIARVFINPVWSGGSTTSVATLVAYTLLDASIWAYAGYVYFKVVYDRKGAFLPAFLLALVLTEIVHQLWWFSTYWVMNTREAAIINVSADWVVLGAGNLFFPYWWLSFGFVAVGFLAGNAARNVIGQGRGEEAGEAE